MDLRKIAVIAAILAVALCPVFHKEAESSEQQKKTVYFTAITLYHPIVMYQRYQPLMEYLTENTPYKFELKLSQDYKDIIRFLKNGTVQVALLGGVTYLEAKKQFNLIPILKPLGHEGKPYYHSVYIARENDKEINSIKDLKGRSVAFASERSTSGYLVPLYELYSKGGASLEGLSKHINLKYHDSVAREVLRGNFDAGAVIDAVADRFKNRGLKIISVSDPIPGLPIVVRADAPQKLIISIKNALLSLDYNNIRHRNIMSHWDEELRYGFAEAKDSDYDSIRKIKEYLNKKGVKIP
jgi:phosphonate transport system substrate-binding protein